VAVLDFLLGPLSENPHRVGRPLRGDLEGLNLARVGTCRAVHEINHRTRMVTVLHVDHRADVCRPR
jgi:mRNA interferase RelE/StbE